MINTITLQNLRNTEFLQFITDALSITLANSPTALKVTEQYNALSALKQVLETLLVTNRSNPMTEELLALDLRRDNAMNGIIGSAQSATYHFDADTKAAAIILTNYFTAYGAGIARDNYASETATLTNIMGDMTNKQNLAAAAATLKLGDWLVEMDTANKAFNQKYLLRTQELGAASDDTMKAKRLEAAQAFYDLRDNLNAYFTINKGTEPFATATNELNALITQYNALLGGRGSKPAVVPSVAVPVA